MITDNFDQFLLGLSAKMIEELLDKVLSSPALVLILHSSEYFIESVSLYDP